MQLLLLLYLSALERGSQAAFMHSFAGPFDLELEHNELCEPALQGLGLLRVTEAKLTRDRKDTNLYVVSSKVVVNYNISDDITVEITLKDLPVDISHKNLLQKNFFYGKWKIEAQALDAKRNNLVLACFRTIIRTVPMSNLGSIHKNDRLNFTDRVAVQFLPSEFTEE